MSKNVLVVVDRNAWVHRSIAAEGSADGLEVVSCLTAKGALSVCCALEPECVVTELALPDHDGLWLVSQLRAQPSEISASPIVITSSDYQEETRIHALRSGAEVFIPKPFNAAELIAQVRSLLALTARIKLHRSPILPVHPAAPDGHERAVIGDLDHISVATALTALELDKRSGHLILAGGTEGRRRLQLTLASGTLIGGLLGGVPLGALEALRDALHWSGKRFEFWPSDRIAPPSSAPLIRELVLQAVRLDEARLPADAPRGATGSSPRNKAVDSEAGGLADEPHPHTEPSRSVVTRARHPTPSPSSPAWSVARAFEEAHATGSWAPAQPPSSSGSLTPRPRAAVAQHRTPSSALPLPPSYPPPPLSSGAESSVRKSDPGRPPSSGSMESPVRKSDPGKAPLSAPGRRLVESVSPSARPDPRIDVPERGRFGLGGLASARADAEAARNLLDPVTGRVPIDDDSPTTKIGTRRR